MAAAAPLVEHLAISERETALELGVPALSRGVPCHGGTPPFFFLISGITSGCVQSRDREGAVT
ncbi:MAG TPA: hypothetical protein VGG97_01680 [Bryobacteraceae bacterium]